jgi:hypothetical protein
MSNTIRIDLDGMMKAFMDTSRQDKEYILDTESGTVHFVPLQLLRAAEKGNLDPEKVPPQDKEKAQVAVKYLDDIEGRYELVPYIDAAAEGEWKTEFLEEHNLNEMAPSHAMAWQMYRNERINTEIEAWLEETGILDPEGESWDDEEE